MAKAKSEADSSGDPELCGKWLVNIFHIIKTAAVLLHPIAPFGTQMLREYLNMDERLWSWEYVFDTFEMLLGKENANHALKFLEPRVDFFARHESQFERK
jgi:methionyl-tRNA synthetase